LREAAPVVGRKKFFLFLSTCCGKPGADSHARENACSGIGALDGQSVSRVLPPERAGA
jgi:hypothetical protein